MEDLQNIARAAGSFPVSDASLADFAQLADAALRPKHDPDSPPAAYLAVERPIAGSVLAQRGKLSGFGWLVSVHRLNAIAVLLDDIPICHATLNIPRPDITELVGDAMPHADHGFWFDCEMPEAIEAGSSTLRFRIDLAGQIYHHDVPVQVSAAVPVAAGSPAQAADEDFRLEFELATFDGGVLQIGGWALSAPGIAQVEVLIDATLIGAATLGRARADVAAALPHLDGAERSGFRFEIGLPPSGIGSGEIVVVARDESGATRSARRMVERLNSLQLFCDELRLVADGHLQGAGWAVCRTGITAIRVEAGGRTLGEARLGLSRPDVGKTFPDFRNALFGGFQIDFRLEQVPAGTLDVQIVAVGGDGEERRLQQNVQAGATAPESALAVAARADQPDLQFYVDLPVVVDGRAAEAVRGFLPIGGWAFARSGLDKIEVFIDGVFHDCAFTGIRRDDIQAVFPDYDALLSGFAILVPPQALKPGAHKVDVYIRDNAGNVGTWTFTLDAELAPEGPGPWRLREKMTHAEIELGRAILQAQGKTPVWTVAIPLGSLRRNEIARLKATILSLERQAYPVWRAIVSLPRTVETDEGPRAAATLLRPDGAIAAAFAELPHLLPRLSFLPGAEDRLVADFIDAGGIFACIAPGDRLGEDALLEISIAAQAAGETAFFYADERRIDPADEVEKAFFKPDWSPDLLLSTHYIGQFWAANALLVAKQGVRLGALGAAVSHDLALCLTEAASEVVHVPKVLSARGDGMALPSDGSAALRAAAARQGLQGRVMPGCLPGTWLVTYDVQALEERGAIVSVIMPSIAARGLVKIAVESIRQRTRWKNVEIIILDNIRAPQDETAHGWKTWMREVADQVIDIDEDFNWSRFNNIGAAAAHGEFLLFLNDDIETTDPDWLHKLLAQAQRAQIGVVGPQLLYPDGRVQHAGVFLGHHVGRHAFRFYPKDAPGPFGLALTQRNVISVTGACMLMRREVFAQVGGFDEAHPVINNDLDFCLRVRRAGLRVLYTPHVSLVHHEMASRSKLRDEYNSAQFDEAWKDIFYQGDPYFHPQLSREYEDYQISSEPGLQFQAGHPLIPADDVKRILAVKVDHIGDFILSFPAFRRIKARFPKARLTVLAARASLALAEMEPAIDEVIEFNFFHARSEKGALALQAEELAALHEKLAPMRFDIAMDLRRQPDTRIILQHTGARWLAGFDRNYCNTWLDIAMEFEGDIERSHKRNHVTTSLMQFVDVVASACTAERDLISGASSISHDARDAWRALPALRGVDAGFFAKPVVAVHSGAGSLNKQWPAMHFSGLIDLLIAQENVSVLIIGGPDEAEFAEGVVQGARYGSRTVSVVGKTSLRELATVLQGCDLYIGNDSGPKHMAASLGVPTIGIHSGSVDAGEWGPIGPRTITLQRAMACSPCYIAKASDCPRNLACLTGLTVGEVFRACQRLLALNGRKRKAVRKDGSAPAMTTQARARPSGTSTPGTSTSGTSSSRSSTSGSSTSGSSTSGSSKSGSSKSGSAAAGRSKKMNKVRSA